MMGEGGRQEEPRVSDQPNENAWLLGLVGAREQRLLTQGVMGLVGARGLAPPYSATQRSLRFLMINRTPRESLPATARSA